MHITLPPAGRRYYTRQMILPDWSDAGQERLKAAHALVVGASGLGAPVMMYLAGAGIGTIGIADGDFVELSYPQRKSPVKRRDRRDG